MDLLSTRARVFCYQRKPTNNGPCTLSTVTRCHAANPLLPREAPGSIWRETTRQHVHTHTHICYNSITWRVRNFQCKTRALSAAIIVLYKDGTRSRHLGTRRSTDVMFTQVNKCLWWRQGRVRVSWIQSAGFAPSQCWADSKWHVGQPVYCQLPSGRE